MSDIQLTGALSLGGTDYSDYISSMVIKRTRTAVTVPANLGNIRETEKAGVLKEALEINFYSDLAAASVWAELYDALDTDTAELTFDGEPDGGTAGADNPHFSGTVVVLGVDTGADVGALREQSITLPITADGITKDTGS